MFFDIETLLIKIRKINNCKIYLIGFYNPFKNLNEKNKIEEIYKYIDTKFEYLESYKNVTYIDIYRGFDEKEYYLPSDKINFPSLEGYNYISNKLIEKFEKKNIDL